MKPITRRLLNWFSANQIPYPWRQTEDPYRIWLSEILLQQTRIPVAIKYYEKILQKYPSLKDLADADEAEFLSLWSGIGYYARGKNMLRCARVIASNHKGRFPAHFDQLFALPGIGPYTAGALLNFCSGRLTPAIDGNINRVLARITNNTHLMNTKIFHSKIEDAFMIMGADAPPREYVQALMELGERICLRNPNCPSCPVRKHCLAASKGIAAALPRRKLKKKPVSVYWYLLLLTRGKELFYVQNDKREFLKSVWIFPDLLSPVELEKSAIRKGYQNQWGIELNGIEEAGRITHAVTFRKITGVILSGSRFRIRNREGKWLTIDELKSHPTSSVTAKALAVL